MMISVYCSMSTGLKNLVEQRAAAEGVSVSAVIRAGLMALFDVDATGRPRGEKTTPAPPSVPPRTVQRSAGPIRRANQHAPASARPGGIPPVTFSGPAETL